MKFFNSTISLGTLAYVSEGLALQSLMTNSVDQNTGSLISLDSNLVHRASNEKQLQVNDMLNAATGMAQAAYEVGLNSWFGWYVTAIVDASADLVTDVVSDVSAWGTEATEGIDSYVEGVTNDVE